MNMKIIMVCAFCVAPFLLTKIINIIFRKIYKKKNNLRLSFLKNMLNALIFIVCIAGLVKVFDKEGVLGQQVLLSSSAIAIVLGIVFQTGLTNIMHGVIIVIYKPFNVSDRIQIDSGSTVISGYVKQITLRHVVVTSIIDNADLIIPNSVMDSSVIRNLTNGEDASNKYPLIVGITYEQAQDKEKRELAKHIISECVLANPRTTNKTIGKEDLFVKVDYEASTVNLTTFVVTQNAENNIIACSEIKEAILDEFAKAGIEFAYNHMEISGRIITTEK